MSWKSHIEELRARERLAEQMGGEERVARQRSQGKLTVRERVAFLADPGSFHEVGKIAGKATGKIEHEGESATLTIDGTAGDGTRLKIAVACARVSAVVPEGG